MQQACRLVMAFTADKSWDEYECDVALRSAVERQCQILGEALWQLSKKWPDVAHRIAAWRDIINFRYVLVHGYDKVDDEVVWGIAKANVPLLLTELDRLLDEEATA